MPGASFGPKNFFRQLFLRRKPGASCAEPANSPRRGNEFPPTWKRVPRDPHGSPEPWKCSPRDSETLSATLPAPAARLEPFAASLGIARRPLGNDFHKPESMLLCPGNAVPDPLKRLPRRGNLPNFPWKCPPLPWKCPLLREHLSLRREQHVSRRYPPAPRREQLPSFRDHSPPRRKLPPAASQEDHLAPLEPAFPTRLRSSAGRLTRVGGIAGAEHWPSI